MNAYRRSPAREITVSEEHAERRLDKFLRSRLKGVPAGLIFRLLRKGAVRVDGRRARPDHRLAAGQVISVPAMDLPPPDKVTVPTPVKKAVAGAIVHESADLLVLNKPADLAVHVGTGVQAGVIEALRELRPGEELELAHRIDRETSGLLMVAKKPTMLRHLQEVLRAGDVERHYLALVRGSFPGQHLRIDAPLLTTDSGVTVHPDGQDALTLVQVQRRFGQRATLIRAQLITGRKHQIRVHTSHSGYPIAGDSRYGDPRFTAEIARLGGHRMFLHAHTLRIPLPDGGLLDVTAPTSPDWDRTLDRLAGGQRTPARRPRRR